ncbi:sensor histidine kinase [Paenibacillus sp. YN15]|uniref:cache domain-containing sensor histidine kinase n=1 Tax=Paenibacillus sp. YN15 TaxID=1742774 RepID=UPI000DCB31B9|nr:sensor histidine kinase [Paenibacillus sp. YN15]RAU91460.1 hypothetical protein DQG13_29345 [Paenibacillus sp. YN15]
MFFSIILLIVVTIAVFSYVESSRSIKSDIERFSTQILKESNLNLERYFQEYEQFLANIAASSTYRQWLKASEVSERISAFTNLKDNYVHSFAIMHPEILSVTILNKNGNENSYTREKGPALRYDYSMKSEVWMPKITISKEMTMLLSPNVNYVEFGDGSISDTVITIVKKYEFTSDLHGYIKMDITPQPIQAILSETKIDANGNGMIVDEQGMLIASTDSEHAAELLPSLQANGLLASAEGSFFLKDSNQMVTYRSIAKTNWKIVSVVPWHTVARSIYRVKDATILIALIGLAVGMVLVVLVSESSTRRLKKLRGVMSQTGLNNLEVRVEIEGRDEVADVSRAYNKMLTNLEYSLKELNQSRTSQQEAVLSALQSQINSHFLYNALESIKFMAYLANQDDIVKTTLALSDMLRYVSNYQNTSVPVQQEIQYVANYLHIMQTQYGEDLTYEIIQGAGTKEVLCLKAVIQPIVENSIRYGLEQTGQHLFVRIETALSSEGYLMIRICDTGPGFNEETLARMNDKLRQSNVGAHYRQLSNIGLLNVHYRLRVYYEDEKAGITICNRADGNGAEVTIILPDRPAKKGEPVHEPDLDCG